MTEPLAAVPDAPAEKPETASFKGETFALNPDISEFAIMEFAEAVDGGLDSGSYAGMAALSRFVVELIAPTDQARFRAVARRGKATAEDLFAFLKGETETDAGRPTGPSADSSDGRESIEQKSVPSSVVKVSPLSGRPDLQLAVLQAQAAAS